MKADAKRNLETGRVLLRNSGDVEDEAEASNSDRLSGAWQVLGGVWQAGLGTVGVVTPEPVTTALGAGAIALGADNIWTGARKIWSGSDEQTATRQAL